MRALLALLFLVAAGSQAVAKIQICNKFVHPIFVTLAFQDKGTWVTEGWLEVGDGKCVMDDKHANVTSFYYYGETNAFNKQVWSWGNEKEFSVKDDDFSLRNADSKQPGARVVKFSGPKEYKLPETVVLLEFHDGGVTFVVPSENKGGDSPQASNSPSAQDDCDKKSGDVAIAGCTTLISNNPNDESAWFNRGIEYSNKKDYDHAIADFSKAISLKPDHANAYNSRGAAFFEKDDYGHAIADLTKAIDLDSNYALPLTNRGNVYRYIRAYDVALKDLNASIGINAKSLGAYYYRAQVQEGLGHKDEAIADYRKVLTIDPNDQDSKDALKRLGAKP